MVFSSVNLDFFIGVVLAGKLHFCPVRHFEGATDGLSTSGGRRAINVLLLPDFLR